jgi:hypothetical protein
MGCGSSKDSDLIDAAKRGDVSGVAHALSGGANTEARSFVRARRSLRCGSGANSR